MKEKSLGYSIEGFKPALGRGFGGCGFTITLRGDVVRAIAKAEKRDEKSPLYNELIHMLSESSDKSDRGLTRLTFYRDTWLLLGIHAGGQCACFGVDGDKRNDVDEKDHRYIKYSPHNVDTAAQASAILSVWLHWFNTIIAITEFQLP